MTRLPTQELTDGHVAAGTAPRKRGHGPLPGRSARSQPTALRAAKPWRFIVQSQMTRSVPVRPRPAWQCTASVLLDASKRETRRE